MIDSDKYCIVVERKTIERLLSENPQEARFVISVEVVNGSPHIAMAPAREFPGLSE